MVREKKFITCDGNMSASHIAYMFSEVSCIYPITPSSNMAEYVDEWAARGKKNLFNEEVKLVEMQSEAGAAGAVHGALQSGALATTFTASQGLLLMIPNMYKIAGELLPCVFHVSARAVASSALSIFGDHSDVYATRQTGFAMLAAGSVQQVMDLSAIAHLTAIKGRIPFLSFFDGFRTSHEIQKIEALQISDLIDLVDKKALKAFRDKALNPENPVTRGTAQNPDIFFQNRESVNKFYDAIPDMVEEYMTEITKLTGREYHPFTYYGAHDAENVVIAMGSVTETIKETIDFLNSKGQKTGLVTVHLYRPFSAKYFLKVIPKSTKKITVLDRTKEPGANGEPLYLDVRSVFYDKEHKPEILSGRYGLGSKDTTPAQIISVFKNMDYDESKTDFTIGIFDDVTFKSLPIEKDIQTSPKGTFEAKFYGIGSDGTVGANKNSIKIIGDATDKYCQAYFAYDSKKSGGFTASHLRFGDAPIRSTYLVNTPDFVACHVSAYVHSYDILKGLKKGGSFLLNSIWDVEGTKKRLPDYMKKYLAVNDIRMYIINATKLGEELGLGNRTNTIMQSAFFKITEVIPYEKAIEEMKRAIVKSYGAKGERIVNMNFSAVEAGGKEDNVIKVDIPSAWKNIKVKTKPGVHLNGDRPEFIKNFVDPINALQGDDIPVSSFVGREDGTLPPGTSQYEKRGIAIYIPEWKEQTCIQCNQCAYVCPHAAIRPYLLTDEELKNAPKNTVTKKALGKALDGLHFRIQVAPEDCTGCGNCEDVCPAPKEKALIMKPLGTQLEEKERYLYMHQNVGYKDLMPKINVKNSQFAQPLFEFSGACAGCGETPYIKTVTQLFGERMIIANATGCSSIYGGSSPSTPYCKNTISGYGPAWANSLFEDNAEYGLGLSLGVNKLRKRIKQLMQNNMQNVTAKTAETFKNWINLFGDKDKSREASDQVINSLKKEKQTVAKDILELQHYLEKKSIWIIGGDGWAYDIGYGGVDHVLASGEDVNMLVLDTEIYSNTGGQASKATPIGAVAKFAATGKRIRKKDLGMMAISYGYVYVAQVAMGANQAQFFKALREAEAYNGPSIIIAYSPCISHGLKASMGKAQTEQKLAVEAGYWQMYRYNPLLENEKKNPFILDSKEPDWNKFQKFLKGEVRYTALMKAFPKEAQNLFLAAEENAKWRYKSYKRQAALDYEQI